MVISEVYNPDQWANFFVLVGTGSAALTGLVFVAVTINLKSIAKDGTHRYRAMNMLTGFTTAFLISSLAIMGHQTHQTIGAEWFIISLLAAIVNTNGYIQAFRLNSSLYALSYFRMIGGSLCYLGQIIGAALFYFGTSAGIYVSAMSLIINFCFLISGSWLLILGPLYGSNK